LLLTPFAKGCVQLIEHARGQFEQAVVVGDRFLQVHQHPYDTASPGRANPPGIEAAHEGADPVQGRIGKTETRLQGFEGRLVANMGEEAPSKTNWFDSLHQMVLDGTVQLLFEVGRLCHRASLGLNGGK
jgi:hypothetical protein